jgi:hypothetical protein
VVKEEMERLVQRANDVEFFEQLHAEILPWQDHSSLTDKMNSFACMVARVIVLHKCSIDRSIELIHHREP